MWEVVVDVAVGRWEVAVVGRWEVAVGRWAVVAVAVAVGRYPPSCIATNAPKNPNIKYHHERFYPSSANPIFFKRRN